MLKKISLTLIVGIFCYISLTGMTFDFRVEQPLLRNDRFETSLPVTIEPGEPMVAYYDLRILLPAGHRFISADLETGRVRTETNVYLDYARTPQPISLPQVDQTRPNRVIYESDSFYPGMRYEAIGVQRKNGHDILILNVYPYSYNPVRGELHWVEDFELTIHSEQDTETAEEQNLFLVQTERVRNRLSSMVINPEQKHSYQRSSVRTDSILPDINEPFRMVIISACSKETIFADYLVWQESRDITAGFFAVEDIYQHYTGVDNQDKIRNFIIDAYQTYAQTDTPLEYVILGGDDNIIPIRGMYGQVGNYVDYNMPADIYYSNLDGNWDANGNGIYGEPGDNVDWFAEVALGRIPAFTDTQFQNFFHKSMHYVDNATYSNDIVYMLGENLDSIPTWGGDYKDQIIPYVPTDYHLDTLYERDGTFSSANVIDAINGGLGIINHIGHANYFIVFGLNNSRIHNLQNTSYGFAYTQGCYPAAFDNATSQESGAVGQNLATTSGGLFAFIGNTRYGWYMPGSTNGPSQAYDITFFSGLYDQNIRELGHTMNYSKEVLVNQAMNSSVMRWIYYQLVLFGDPSIEVKDPNGTFPYLEPVDVVFDDVSGDNDGMVNPGETIHIYVELKNLPDWSDAYDVTASIAFQSDHIYLLEDTVYYGDIAHSTSATNSANPFIIELDPNIPYGTYKIFFQVTAEGSNSATFSRVYELSMPVTLIQKHWPWASSYPISASPIFTDFTGDRIGELVIVDVLGNINLLDAQANFLQDPLTNQENLWRSFSMGDLTGNGDREIVIASRLNKIKAIGSNGDLIFSYDECGQQILTPIIADLNNNGNMQVISLGLDRNLYVLEANGELTDGFPVQLPQTSVADLAVADLNHDGYREIIIGAIDGNLYVVRHDGSIDPDFQISLGAGIVTAPIVLDNKNIAVGTSNNKLFLISPEGQIIFEKSVPQRLATEVIAADFTGNSELELAFVTYNGVVALVDQTGEYLEGWPVYLNQSFMQPPLAVDMTGDGSVNLIVSSSPGNVFGFNVDGSMADSFPVPLNTSITSPASIADIDGDGDWDIIVATSGGITVIDYKLPLGMQTPWNMYRGNSCRTGYFGDNTTTDIELPDTGFVTALNQNYPNPFNPLTRINFSLKADSPVTIDVFNIKGQKVTTLLNKELTAGHHTVVWNGTNDHNRAVGSGVYFYRLSTSDTTLTRKMLLLK